MKDIQIGIPFRLIKDWRSLFQKDVWFQWQARFDRGDLILKRLTVVNVIKFYFYQVAIRTVLVITYPALKLAYKFWNDVPEGEEAKVITDRMLMTTKMPDIKFFRLDK